MRVKIRVTLWAFAAALLAGVYLHYWRFRASAPLSRTRWLPWAAPWGVLLYLAIDLPLGNEYKIVLLWSVPLGFVIVLGLSELVEGRGRALRPPAGGGATL